MVGAVRSGFNSWRGSHDLVARSYALAVRLGLPSRLMTISLVHETLLSVSGLYVFRLTTSNFILNSILALLKFKDRFHLMFRKLGCTGRADEDRIGVRLGAGTVDTTDGMRRAC